MATPGLDNAANKLVQYVPVSAWHAGESESDPQRGQQQRLRFEPRPVRRPSRQLTDLRGHVHHGYPLDTLTQNGLTLGGIVSGANFTKAGAGVMDLTNTGNKFSGHITVNQGVLAIDTDAELGTTGR